MGTLTQSLDAVDGLDLGELFLTVSLPRDYEHINILGNRVSQIEGLLG
ncbi:MAG: hypothetical protein AAGA91_16195 [Pseudomonadota bacterium]